MIGETDLIALQVGTAMLGIGSASVFATGILWFEERIELTNKVGALFIFAVNNGQIVFLVLVGHLIEENPVMFLNLQVRNIVTIYITF